VEIYDPYVDNVMLNFNEPKIFFIATKHEIFKEMKFPKGSIAIDPWRYIPAKEGVTVKWIGKPSA